MFKLTGFRLNTHTMLLNKNKIENYVSRISLIWHNAIFLAIYKRDFSQLCKSWVVMQKIGAFTFHTLIAATLCAWSFGSRWMIFILLLKRPVLALRLCNHPTKQKRLNSWSSQLKSLPVEIIFNKQKNKKYFFGKLDNSQVVSFLSLFNLNLPCMVDRKTCTHLLHQISCWSAEENLWNHVRQF